MRVRKWRWVVRTANNVVIFVSAGRPIFNEWDIWANGGYKSKVCIKSFKLVFGFLPPEGKPVKIELTAKLLTEE